MENAGIDTSVYKPHSARSATVSKVASLGIPTDVILSRAGLKSDNCFATIARWVKTVMENAGIDTSVYKPHSARSATVSKAASLGIPTDVILSRAGWKSDNCFAKYYLKPIELDGGSEFQSAVLQLD